MTGSLIVGSAECRLARFSFDAAKRDSHGDAQTRNPGLVRERLTTGSELVELDG
jgi:hypothetical protein